MRVMLVATWVGLGFRTIVSGLVTSLTCAVCLWLQPESKATKINVQTILIRRVPGKLNRRRLAAGTVTAERPAPTADGGLLGGGLCIVLPTFSFTVMTLLVASDSIAVANKTL